jgi:TRAP-type C4-dicarboxylate transport system substrate-binding protein
MKYLTLVVIAPAFFWTAFAGTAIAQQEIRLLNAFDSRYPPTKILVHKFAETIEQKSGNKVKFRISGPEVVNAFQQFQPASSGAFDVFFTVQPYHVGTTSVSFGIYSIDPDPEAFRKAGVLDYLDKEYERFNLKILAIIPGQNKGTGAYHAALSKPVTADGDIKGMRVRGNPLYRPLIDKLGASMVNLQVGEVYSAMQKGTIDGAFGPITGSMDYKWYEVGKYSMRPNFGYIYQFLLVHRGNFAKLPADVQKLMADEAAAMEVPGMRAMNEVQLKEDADLKKVGVIQTQLNPDKAAAAIKAFNEGIWETATNSKATGDRAKEFQAFMKQKGFLK